MQDKRKQEDTDTKNLKKQLRDLKWRHDNLLKSYKELFKEKKKLEDKIEFLEYVIKR